MATVINTAKICVACDGQGKTVGYACPGFRRIEMPCAPCGGSGVAPLWQAEAVARGTAKLLERLKAAREFVEMAACADNSGQEYDPVCQECRAPNNQHTSGCRLAIWLEGKP